MAHIILFEHINFHGAHKHVVSGETNLNAGDDNFFNDRVSSLVIVEGNWKFYRDSGFRGEYPDVVLGPGLYPNVTAIGIRNDDMSSLQPVSDNPTRFGVPLDSHVILFEHANFHGAHKHVFGPVPNLNTPDDNFFNDRVSSIAVMQNQWVFYPDPGLLSRPYPVVLGRFNQSSDFPSQPGGYPFVGFVGIRNDDMSALQPVSAQPTVRNPLPVQNGVILFEHAGFHGAHKHVIYAEPNLNASDDSFFNDRVSSIAVLSGEWEFFRDWNFEGAYPRILGKGIYDFVTKFEIRNDDLSSLAPINLSGVLRTLPAGGGVVVTRPATAAVK